MVFSVCLLLLSFSCQNIPNILGRRTLDLELLVVISLGGSDDFYNMCCKNNKNFDEPCPKRTILLRNCILFAY